MGLNFTICKVKRPSVSRVQGGCESSQEKGEKKVSWEGAGERRGCCSPGAAGSITQAHPRFFPSLLTRFSERTSLLRWQLEGAGMPKLEFCLLPFTWWNGLHSLQVTSSVGAESQAHLPAHLGFLALPGKRGQGAVPAPPLPISSQPLLS